MTSFPPTIHRLIEVFNQFPGIGSKTSERFVFYLLKQPQEFLDRLALSLQQLKQKISLCSQCYQFTEKNPCSICADFKRNSKLLCVVAESSDILALEKTGQYYGLYHVLGGTINQIEGVGPEQLRIQELVQRIKNGVQEVILATNPDLEGESTALYLANLLQKLHIKTTRLGRGLPMGSSVEYADEVTLSDALAGRKEFPK